MQCNVSLLALHKTWNLLICSSLSPTTVMDGKIVLDRSGHGSGWFVWQGLSGHYLDGSTSGSETLLGKLHSLTFCGQKLGPVICFAGYLHYIFIIFIIIHHKISHIYINNFTEDGEHLESIRVLRDEYCPYHREARSGPTWLNQKPTGVKLGHPRP